MKQEDLFEAIGDLDEALLDENVTELPKRRNFSWIAPAAACLVLVGGAIAVPYAMRGGLPVVDTPNEPVTPIQTVVTTTDPTMEHEELTDATVQNEQPKENAEYPFLRMQSGDIKSISVEIEFMGITQLNWLEIDPFLERIRVTPFVPQDTVPPDKGAYMQWYIKMDDGTELKLSHGKDSDLVYLNDRCYQVNETLRSIVLYGENLMQKSQSAINPAIYSSLTVENVEKVFVSHLTQGVSTYLTETQLERFMQLLSELHIVGKQNEVLFGDSLSFEITRKDGTKLPLNSGLFEMENYEPLMNFGYTVLQMQDLYHTTTFEILPPTEEWLGRVYFGSEFPYFIYGDEDYCVFTEGMDGLFIFDFNKGEITFSANITETFTNAGIAHGVEGWNGVGLSAYKENGEVKLLCTASSGGDGTGTRGFTVDVENGTLTEIPDFDRNNLDIIEYVYNVPADGLPYLFGAAPIPLEDGYICFENSGLNNEVLPGEGSHLPMIMIRKVKGDTVKDWIPFKDVMPIIKSGG